MKPAQKSFVVEFKNRRRSARKDASIWGHIDLEVAGGENAVEPMASDAIDRHLHQASALQNDGDITA